MELPDQNRVRDMRHNFDLTGADAAGKKLVSDAKPQRVKVFKSGNSLALRLPKGLGFEAGIEMELTPDGRGGYTMRRADAPKPKFNIDKVWGSATSLRPIDEDDRWFEERELDWTGKAGKDG